MKNRLVLSLQALFIITIAIASAPAKACSSDPMLGGICVFAGNFPPRGWAFTDGQILPINSNQSLYALLGTTYGGDGRTSFALPDLRGRAAIGSGHGSGLSSYFTGQKVGQEFVALTIAQMPSHSHVATTNVEVVIPSDNINVSAILKATNVTGTQGSPSGAILAQNSSGSGVYSTSAPSVFLASDSLALSINATANTTNTTTVLNAGGSQGHENRMPYLAVHFVIALQGIFPPRN